MNTLSPSELFYIPADVEEFFEEVETTYMLDQPRTTKPERRESERLHITMPVQINLLDEDYGLVDGFYEGVTRDVSRIGVGLVTLDPLGRRFVLLKLNPSRGKPLNVVARIVYEKQIGFYYQYGCQFITPISDQLDVE